MRTLRPLGGKSARKSARGHVQSFAQDDIVLINRDPIEHLIGNFLPPEDRLFQRQRGSRPLWRVEDIYEGRGAGLAQRCDPHLVNSRTQRNRRRGTPKNGMTIIRNMNSS